MTSITKPYITAFTSPCSSISSRCGSRIVELNGANEKNWTSQSNNNNQIISHVTWQIHIIYQRVRKWHNHVPYPRTYRQVYHITAHTNLGSSLHITHKPPLRTHNTQTINNRHKWRGVSHDPRHTPIIQLQMLRGCPVVRCPGRQRMWRPIRHIQPDSHLSQTWKVPVDN